MLYENLTFSLPPAGIVGIIGPNGAGKTTLFKMITGAEKPDAGTFAVGETVKFAYVDQEHDDLKPDDTVFQAITGGSDLILVGGKEINSRAYVSKFNFSGTDQSKKVKELSVIFCALLTFFYLFIFVIIQLQDYSLLIGSVGLFMIISVIMYFSKNIKWYKEDNAA